MPDLLEQETARSRCAVKKKENGRKEKKTKNQEK